MMSYIRAAVIVVSLYFFTLLSGEKLFKCQGETVILDFGKVGKGNFDNGTTVSWYKKNVHGETKLIAHKVENGVAIVQAAFANSTEIDSNLNLVFRNVSSELNGEYFRRIVNGGIFSSSVNLFVMYAPSGKPIISKEKQENGKESFNLELPYLGNPEANVTIKHLKMNITNNTGTIQQYEICLNGRSLRCLKESPCQNFTIRIGQSGIPMQEIEKAPCQNSNIKNESPRTESHLNRTIEALTLARTFIVVKSCIHIGIISVIFCLVSIYNDCIMPEKSIFIRKLIAVYWIAAGVIFVPASIGLIILNDMTDKLLLVSVVELCYTVVSYAGLIVIIIQKMRTVSGGTSDGKKNKKQKTTLKTSENADVEACDMEAKETLLGKSKADSTKGKNFKGKSKGKFTSMERMSVDKTNQNDDIGPGCSNSV